MRRSSTRSGIRTAVADLLPNQSERAVATAAAEPVVVAVALNAEGAPRRTARRTAYLDRLNNATMPTGATLCGVDQKNPCYQP